MCPLCSLSFFFNDTATTEIYTLSLHDALPISTADEVVVAWPDEFLKTAPVDKRTVICVLTHDPKFDVPVLLAALKTEAGDRKSTRLNSSHANISYAVFCLKKKKE